MFLGPVPDGLALDLGTEALLGLTVSADPDVTDELHGLHENTPCDRKQGDSSHPWTGM
jgi:hypothetical protein